MTVAMDPLNFIFFCHSFKTQFEIFINSFLFYLKINNFKNTNRIHNRSQQRVLLNNAAIGVIQPLSNIVCTTQTWTKFPHANCRSFARLLSCRGQRREIFRMDLR